MWLLNSFSQKKPEPAILECQEQRSSLTPGEPRLPAIVRRGLRSVHAAPSIEPEIQTLLHRSRARRGWGRLLFAALGASALVMLAFFAATAWPGPLRFTVADGTGEALESGWVGAEASTPLPLRFSDGSAIDLAAGSRARVSALGFTGASLILEDGRMHVCVVHRALADWTIGAGPYSIRIVGTELDIAWHPDDSGLEVEVASGQVRVSGPQLDGEQTVSAGQRLALAVPRANVDLQSWVPLAAGGEYQRALALVLRKGFESVVEASSAGELLLLSDAARIGGQPSRASASLQAVRRRFPNSDEASIAAYTLGVDAFEQERAYAEAATWFETYLRERPHGALAADALGRIVECEAFLGRRDKAEAAARQYLASYPTGAHRDVAARLASY